jgi:hypothetical protein
VFEYTRSVDHLSSLNEIQRVVGKYATQYDLLVAAGPVTAATIVKTFITNNKAVKFAMVGSGVWFAVREVSGPTLGMITEQFGYLQQIMASFKG